LSIPRGKGERHTCNRVQGEIALRSARASASGAQAATMRSTLGQQQRGVHTRRDPLPRLDLLLAASHGVRSVEVEAHQVRTAADRSAGPGS